MNGTFPLPFLPLSLAVGVRKPYHPIRSFVLMKNFSDMQLRIIEQIPGYNGSWEWGSYESNQLSLREKSYRLLVIFYLLPNSKASTIFISFLVCLRGKKFMTEQSWMPSKPLHCSHLNYKAFTENVCVTFVHFGPSLLKQGHPNLGLVGGWENWLTHLIHWNIIINDYLLDLSVDS